MSLIEGLQLPFGIQPINPVPVNAWEGPYASVAEALALVPIEVRYPTMEVRVLDSAIGNKKYWFKDGVEDSDLVEFGLGVSIITGITETLETKFDKTGGTVSGYIIASGFTGDGGNLTNLTIGQPEDLSYSDGIFEDLTPTTKVGVIVDRFNEMFKLLAPTPPSDWNTTTLNLTNTIYQAKKIGSGELVSVITDTSPNFSVGVPQNGLSDVDNGELSFFIDDNIQETYDFKNHPNKVDGVIRYTFGDPYAGQPGKSGFWVGFTSASIDSEPLVASELLKTAKFTHTTKGDLIKTFYLDAPLTPSINGITATIPDMTGYVSGIKTMTAGQVITNIGFNISGASSYFYPVSSIWKIIEDDVYEQEGVLNSTPTTYNETGVVGSVSTSITNNKFDNSNVSFTVQVRNYIGSFGGDLTFTDITKRIDTVSKENERLTSGIGNYPTTFGSIFDSKQSLISDYSNELQLVNGSYIWLAGDYTAFGSHNYSSVTTGDNISGTHYRWATFNVGNKSSAVNNITITIPSATIGSSWNAIKMYVKIGASGWLDATVAQAVAAPYNDGEAALNVAASTAYNVRVVTFGTIPRSGAVYVRIGIKAIDTSFTFKKPTMA